MKKSLLMIIASSLLLVSCNKFKETEDGIKYRLLKTEADARSVAKEDMLLINMLGVTELGDSILFDTYKNGKPFYIPAEEPTLKNFFTLLKKGDSVEFLVNADTLFMKSFGSMKPKNMSDGENVKFIITLVDVLNNKELEQKRIDQSREYIVNDSLALNNFLSGLKDVKETTSGLKYVELTPGKGKNAVANEKVTVKYRGTLLNGTVFDETREGNPDFTFTVGMGQVIKGWDEALSLMNTGAKYQFIIPWSLAYGERGSGPIPPFSSLVFEVELLKISK